MDLGIFKAQTPIRVLNIEEGHILLIPNSDGCLYFGVVDHIANPDECPERVALVLSMHQLHCLTGEATHSWEIRTLPISTDDHYTLITPFKIDKDE